MKKQLNFLLALALISLFACTDFQEVDLSEEKVAIVLPQDSAAINASITSFWWDPVDGVDFYELTIVSPSFENAQQLVLRTSVTGTTYDTTLTSGTYQWNIVGKNSGFETISENYTLFVETDSSADLSTKAVLLTSPSNGAISNTEDITFKWNEVDQADFYTLQIGQPDFSDASNITVNESLNNNQFTAILTEGEYEWRVRAENLFSVSPYSKHTLTVDLMAPSAPILVSPADGATLPLPIELTWTTDASSVLDSVYFYTDSTSTPVLQIGTPLTSYTFNDGTFSAYFWRVRSNDASGNKSGFSNWRRFFVQ